MKIPPYPKQRLFYLFALSIILAAGCMTPSGYNSLPALRYVTTYCDDFANLVIAHDNNPVLRSKTIMTRELPPPDVSHRLIEVRAHYEVQSGATCAKPDVIKIVRMDDSGTVEGPSGPAEEVPPLQ